MRACVAGGTGFIGFPLVQALLSRSNGVALLTRDPQRARQLWPNASVTCHRVELGAGRSGLAEACRGADTVFHLAGYAHASDQETPEAARLHHQTTVVGTQSLLDASVAAGVRRFVFLSSVKAMGEAGGNCLDEDAMPHPTTFYGRAKRDAELAVLEAGEKHRMQVVVLRLPLVYGAGVKGNWRRMIEAVDRGRFPPIPEVGNKRSMVDVRDVVQALLLAAENEKAHGHVYIVTDGNMYSTRQIYEWINAALGRTVPRWTVPLVLLQASAKLGDVAGRLGLPAPINSDALEKLLGSACYSSERIQRDLGFRPEHFLRDVVPEMVAAYRRTTHV
jgi:nucleoside-diphosphate-sugar epimerase